MYVVTNAMISNTAAYADDELYSILTEARNEYEVKTKEQTPPTLTENLNVENFWEAEEQMLEIISDHISEHGGFQNRELLEDVVLWKFSPGVGRIRDLPSKRVYEISKQAFSADKASEAMAVLSELDGIAASMAGAILTFVNPHRYTIMDPRATNALTSLGYWNYPCEASVDRYETYCLRCQEISRKTGLSLRAVDRALYVISDSDPENYLN